MMGRIIAASIAVLMLLMAIPVSMAASEKIEPYKGMIGADSPLYKLKLYIQELDESLSLSANSKLEKQLWHAEERLAEAQAAIDSGNIDTFDAALSEYTKKLEDINKTMENEDVDEDHFVETGIELYKHQVSIQSKINDTMTRYTYRWQNAYGYVEKIKNGRPFIYLINNTTHEIEGMCFLPPGQAKKYASGNYTLPRGIIKKNPNLNALDIAIINGSGIKPKKDNYRLSLINGSENATLILSKPLKNAGDRDNGDKNNGDRDNGDKNNGDRDNGDKNNGDRDNGNDRK